MLTAFQKALGWRCQHHLTQQLTPGNIMNIREKIDAAYEKHTLAPLRAEAQKQAERNDVFNSSRKATEETVYFKEERDFLAEAEVEFDVAVEAEIKAIVAQKHCSREKAKNELRARGQ